MGRPVDGEVEQELDAMARLHAVLEPLPARARARVLRWVRDLLEDVDHPLRRAMPERLNVEEKLGPPDELEVRS